MVEKKQINTLSVNRIKNFHSKVEIGNKNNQKDPLNSKYKYTKVLVEDPYNNRDLIAKIAKKQEIYFLFLFVLYALYLALDLLLLHDYLVSFFYNADNFKTLSYIALLTYTDAELQKKRNY